MIDFPSLLLYCRLNKQEVRQTVIYLAIRSIFKRMEAHIVIPPLLNQS